MEIIVRRYEQLAKGYTRLLYMIDKYQSMERHAKQEQGSCADEHECLAYRDSMIKRFEFCYDLTWKFLKELLRQQGIEASSPRTVFQESSAQKIISIEESLRWIAFIDSRNLTTHTYDEDTADRVAQIISSHRDFFLEFSKKLSL